MSQQALQSWLQLSVEELLSLPVFKTSRLLGGSAGLSRQVDGINLAETPDYSNWLKNGELMITTCAAIADDPAALDALIPKAAAAGIAGVCVLPGFGVDFSECGLVSAADTYGIPLIKLEQGASLTEVTKSVSDLILKRQTDFLKRVLSANDLLIKLIVEGATLDEIVNMLSGLVEAPVLIIDSINNRRAMSLTKQARLAFMGLGASDEDVARMITENSHVQPLYVDNRTFGYLYIYDASRPLSPINQSIIERISQTIPLEIARERSTRETENVHFKDFFLHILSDKLLDEQKEELRARSFGIEPSDRHIVIRANIRVNAETNAQYAAMLQRTFLHNELKTLSHELGFSLKLAKMNDRYILLLSAPETSAAFTGVSRHLKETAGKLRAQYPALMLSIGYGRPSSGLRGITQSGDDALTALKVCETMHDTGGGIVGFDEIGLFRLIYAQDPEKETSAYIDETIGALITSEKTRSTELLATLESYFQNFGNLKRVSEETFTHYNTVVYRLKSIKEITGYDVRDPDERFRLEVALKLYRLISLEKGDVHRAWHGQEDKQE